MPRYDKDVTDCLRTTSLVFLCNSITHWETKPCYFLCLLIVVSQQHQWLLLTLLTNQITVLDFLITISLLAYQQDPWLPSDSCCSSHDKACPPLDSGSPHWCLPHPVTKSNRKHIIHGIHQNKTYLLLNTWTCIRFLYFWIIGNLVFLDPIGWFQLPVQKHQRLCDFRVLISDLSHEQMINLYLWAKIKFAVN